MGKPVNFNRMALAAIDAAIAAGSRVFSTDADVARFQRSIAEQLRLVWNLRGAADYAAVQADTVDMPSITIRSLDLPATAPKDIAQRARERVRTRR